ncbi:MAG TPA: LAGLIDADG family homing endonuclease [Candidatus Babeliales bacterium]|nr:LAGLIDADG family homing endonuclease [Candidatus Babeliales bacterium]
MSKSSSQQQASQKNAKLTHYTNAMNNKIKLAYFAGALDGDGSFSLIKGTSHSSVSPLYYPMIQFANANQDIVNVFRSEFGGSKSTRQQYIAKNGSARLASYQWKLEKSTKCLPFLEGVIPYLIVKHKRAVHLRTYIINNPFVRGSNRLSDTLLARREKAFLKMKFYNERPVVEGELLNELKRKDSNGKLFWSYVAGLMDTDGSFSLKKENRKTGSSKSPVYTPTILLTMTDCSAIYHIMNNFNGGNMCKVIAKKATQGFAFRFSITSRKNAIRFLEKCIPYLFLKKHIAQELHIYCSSVKNMNGDHQGVQEQLLLRDMFYRKIKELNNGVYKASMIGPEAK